MNRPLPEGWHNVTPRLFARDPEKLVQLLKDVFDATAVFETTRPSVLWIGDSNVMVSGVGPRGATSSLLYLYVDDTDATFRGALDAGASPIEAPTDTPCGDRRAMVRNPSGNDWQIATPAGGTER